MCNGKTSKDTSPLLDIGHISRNSMEPSRVEYAAIGDKDIRGFPQSYSRLASHDLSQLHSTSGNCGHRASNPRDLIPRDRAGRRHESLAGYKYKLLHHTTIAEAKTHTVVLPTAKLQETHHQAVAIRPTNRQSPLHTTPAGRSPVRTTCAAQNITSVPIKTPRSRTEQQTYPYKSHQLIS